jgi:CBS domain-containing protein
MYVKDIMSTNPACCTAETSLQEVAKMMVMNDCGSIPVVENNAHNKLIGVITDRDITCRTIADGKNPLDLSAGDIMTKKVYTVTPKTPIEDCLKLMEEKQIRRVPVIDDSGNCNGMVAQADIAINIGNHKTAELVQKISEESAKANAG